MKSLHSKIQKMAAEGSSVTATTSNGDAISEIAGELNHLDIGSRQEFAAENPKIDNEHNSSSTTEIEVEDDGGVQITCFSDIVNDVNLHFQIIRFPKQIYAWIGCNSAKFGSLYAAAPTRPSNTVSVTSLLGGASDKTGYSIAHRIVIRTGLNVALACNIPKDNPMLEVAAQKKLVEKLIALGVTKAKP